MQVMWLIGVAKEDVTLMGQLLGIKLARFYPN